MNRAEQAVAYKHSGSNCCQAVLMAAADALPLEMETLRRLGAAFGSGMGCLEATCGALCGAEMALGLLQYQGVPIRREAASLLQRFAAETGATKCADLKGVGRGAPLCTCEDCIRVAVQALEALGLLPETEE